MVISCLLIRGVDIRCLKVHKQAMKAEKPEFTEDQKAYFRECGRKGGNSRTVTQKSREASRKSMNLYWERVRSGELQHRPLKKPKQQDLEL